MISNYGPSGKIALHCFLVRFLCGVRNNRIARRPGLSGRSGRPVAGWPGRAEAGHYYDTFAFRDQHCRSHQPFCGFARCRFCAVGRPAGYPLPLVPTDQCIVDVTSAYGGFALVPSPIVADPRLRWGTYAGELPEGRSLCEHVVFCDRLRTLTGKRVVVLQEIDDVYRAEVSERESV